MKFGQKLSKQDVLIKQQVNIHCIDTANGDLDVLVLNNLTIELFRWLKCVTGTNFISFDILTEFISPASDT